MTPEDCMDADDRADLAAQDETIRLLKAKVARLIEAGDAIPCISPRCGKAHPLVIGCVIRCKPHERWEAAKK